ncbi:MAG: polysaccharide biosynthesis C-terminal domain-containing protein [Huintestinicola sp.]
MMKKTKNAAKKGICRLSGRSGQGFLLGSAVLMLSAVITKIIGALFKIPLTNMLGGTGMGYFSAAYGLFMPVYAVSVTGLPAAVAKSTAEACASGKKDMLPLIRNTALKMFGAAGFIGTLLICLAAYPFCKFVSGNTAALPAVIAIAPTVAAGCLAAVYRGCFEGMRNMIPTAVSQVIEALFKLFLGLALCFGVLLFAEKYPVRFLELTGAAADADLRAVALPYAAAAAVLGITAASFAGLAYMYFTDRAFFPSNRVKTSYAEKKNIRRRLLKTAVPAAAGALVTNLTSIIDLGTIMRSLAASVKKTPWLFSELLGQGIAYADMPNFIFGSFNGIAVTIFNLVPSLTNMLGKGMLPSAAAAKAEGDREKLGKCTYNVVLAAAVISMPAGMGIAAMSRPIMELLFSGRTAEISICVKPMIILGLAVPFLCISSSAFAVLQAVGRADIPVKLMAAGAAVKLAGNMILTYIPKLNVSGAALSTLICYGFICGASLSALKRYAELDAMKTLVTLLKLLPGAVLCGASAFFVYFAPIFSEHQSVRTLFSCFLGAIIYIIITYFSGVITKSTLKSLIS